MLDQGRVEVEAAEIVGAARGGHREAGAAALAGAVVAHDGHIEGAAAEVEDRERSAGRHRAAQHVGEVARGGDRLGDQPRPGRPPGLAEGVGEHRAPGRAPGRRMRQDGRRQLAGGGNRLAGDRGEQGREQVGHPDRGVAELHRAVVDVALGVRLEPAGLGLTEAQRVGAHVQPPGGVEIDRRRQQRLAVEQQRPGAPVGVAQHGDRVRGAQVDAEHEAVDLGHAAVPSATRLGPVMLRPAYDTPVTGASAGRRPPKTIDRVRRCSADDHPPRNAPWQTATSSAITSSAPISAPEDRADRDPGLGGDLLTDLICVLRVRDGRVVLWREYQDTLAIAQAMGA
jgi:hypothetical protein